MFDNEDFIEKLRLNPGDPHLSMIDGKKYKLFIANDPLYKKYMPHCIKRENRYALMDVYAEIDLKDEKDYNIREKSFIKATLDYFDSESDEALHESIGKKISKSILSSIIRKTKNIKDEEEAKFQYFIWLIYHFIEKIFEDEKDPGFFKDVHQILLMILT